jgi:hypothetical protein
MYIRLCHVCATFDSDSAVFTARFAVLALFFCMLLLLNKLGGRTIGSTSGATSLTNADDDRRPDRMLAVAYQLSRSCAVSADDPT